MSPDDFLVIENEKQYELALDRILEIWDSVPGSPESGEFNSLANAIEAYEDIHYPIGDPPCTGS
jgi:antitoxin component HigA of HigAB toxin-antitoxin module